MIKTFLLTIGLVSFSYVHAQQRADIPNIPATLEFPAHFQQDLNDPNTVLLKRTMDEEDTQPTEIAIAFVPQFPQEIFTEIPLHEVPALIFGGNLSEYSAYLFELENFPNAIALETSEFKTEDDENETWHVGMILMPLKKGFIMAAIRCPKGSFYDVELDFYQIVRSIRMEEE
jgi:hypothetical protein